MHPQTCGERLTNLLDQVHPDSGFALLSMAALIPLLVLWGRDADTWVLSQAPQNGFRLWFSCEHRLQKQAAPLGEADLPNASHLASMRQVNVSRVLSCKNDSLCFHALSCLLLLRLQQCVKADILCDPRKRYKAFTSFQLCCCLGKEAEASRTMARAAWTARLGRRISCNCACPNVCLAHASGFNTMCVFISPF